MKVLKLTIEGHGSCLLRADDLETKVNNPLDIVEYEVKAMIEEASADRIIIELTAMEEEAYNALPEFEGW
jgi:hypothetical protein